MKHRHGFLLLFSVVTVVGLAGTAWGQAAAHLDHLMKSWSDTPGKVGLVTILEDEAQTAATHAQYGNPCNPDSMRTHVPHVRNAIDPSAEPKGPGKGYGVVKAAKAIAAHMDMARKSPDASEGLKMHSEHIITCANNIATWGDEIMAASKKAQSGDPAAMKEIQDRVQWILKGRDANGDGKITWEKGEGGIAQMKMHLGMIKQ